MRNQKYKGLWINFESGEGGGKGTQVRDLINNLEDRGYIVRNGREPGSTEVGEYIRRALQDPDIPELDKKTEMLLYIAAGIEFFKKEVKPALKDRNIYITDRWRYSTEAYQGYGLGIDLDLIKRLTRFSCDGAYPDLTFLIDVKPKTGLSRISGNEFKGHKKDKIESRTLSYHEKVNNGYLKIARQNPRSFKVIPYIDGNTQGMQNMIMKEVDSFIHKNNLENILKKK